MVKIGDKISLSADQYEILDNIGQGAYGIIWKARRVSDREMVALKTVQTHSPRDKTPYDRQTCAKLSNP